MADDVEALRQIDDALRQRNFRRDWSSESVQTYRGHFDFGKGPIDASIQIENLDFVRIPPIYIADPKNLYEQKLPHVIGSNGFVCYFDATSTVLDRYNPGGTVLRCLDRAHQVLDSAIKGRLDQDFAAEFQAYWRGLTAYIDLPKDFDGDDAVVYWLCLRDDLPDMSYAVITRSGNIPTALLKQHQRVSGKSAPTGEVCTLLRIDTALTVDPFAKNWPPSTLAAFREWIVTFAPNAVDSIKTAISKDGRNRWWLLLRATNGFFLVRIELPSAFQKPEFIQNRRPELGNTLLIAASSVPISRLTGSPIDRDYVYGRALHEMKGLGRKKILLIGCGTIGGFLAQYLAESGAGTGDGGELSLLDNGTFETANLGRHVLGIPHLGLNKAEACRNFLTNHLPHMNVQAVASDALLAPEKLLNYDLVIDATGEQALSIALNEFAIRNRPRMPPILFVYLRGNGVAAQAIMCADKDFACFKCLEPVLGKPRFPVEKENPELVRNLSCGDTTYIPFPVSRSVQAAALALDMVLDWANGTPRPYFRTRVLDEKRAGHHPKDANPAALPQCPACSHP